VSLPIRKLIVGDVRGATLFYDSQKHCLSKTTEAHYISHVTT
jgi:hypothetical protein